MKIVRELSEISMDILFLSMINVVFFKTTKKNSYENIY